MSKPHDTPWYKSYEDYISGAFFGLVSLDIFMFLVHCLTTRSPNDYSLATLAVSIPLLLVWSFERLYTAKEQH